MWLALRAAVILAVAEIPVLKSQQRTPFEERIENMIPTYMSFTEPPDWNDSWPDVSSSRPSM
jgi:hypothetical protein